MRVESGAIRVMFKRCLYVKFSDMELFPQLPQPNVFVTGKPFCNDPPAVVALGALTIRRETDNSLPALIIFAWLFE